LCTTILHIQVQNNVIAAHMTPRILSRDHNNDASLTKSKTFKGIMIIYLYQYRTKLFIC